MSCQIKTIASLIDVDNVKKHLFPLAEPVDSWQWPDEESLKSNGKEVAWLQECCISLSSTGELLVIAHKNVMIVLTSKWDSQEQGDVKMKYHITWHGNPCKDENVQITSVLCLPLIFQGKSSHCGPDWTCIVVGLSSGFVQFYTENCSLLLSELLHNEPVTHLKCQSFEPPRFSTAQEHSEELYVMYHSAVCVLMGFELFLTLRACRNQLARVKANCKEMMTAPPLAYKKWGFTEQNVVTDSEVVGPATNNTFDHLVTASLCGGFNTNYRSSAPQMSLILAVGKKPYVGFHYALEGEAPPVFAGVTKAVVSKVKAAFGQVVPSWIVRGKQNSSLEKDEKNVPIEPAVSMVCRFGLCDLLRHGDRLVMSPNRNLSVVSDSLGRIILIDNLRGLAVRMWKGYRDAQCGWLEVQEDTGHGGISSRNAPPPRMALYLVIYEPKQGVIEIWAMQQGPRVARFTASKSGRLLHVGYGFMGLNNIPLEGGNKPQFACVFVDPSGLIKEISVPFHFALSDKNSKRTRDLHLLKKLKAFLKENDYDNDKLIEEIQKRMQELKTNDIRTQAIEMLSSSKYITPDALEVALNVVDNLISEDADSVDHSCKMLQHTAQQLQRLVSFYQFIHREHQIPPTYSTVVAGNLNSSQSLSVLLYAPEREVNGLRKLVATIDSVALKTKSEPEARVAFREDGKTAFAEFLSCFEVGGPSQESSAINLKKNISEDKLKRNSEMVYQGTLYSDTKVEDWKRAAAKSHIEPAHLMQLALHFWLQKREGAALEAEMLRFTELLKAICSLADVNIICAEYNELSSWWRDVRRILTDSTNPFMALTAAIVCRAVALSVEKEKECNVLAHDISMPNGGPADAVSLQQGSSAVSPDDETHSSISEWESVSHDTCQWSLLIGQLEDVALLDTVLRQKPTPGEGGAVPVSARPQLYCCSYSRPAVSLSYILTKGTGSVSELVARWLSSAGLDPHRLVDLSDVEFDNIEEHPEEGNFRKAASVDIKDGSKLEVEQCAEATPANEHESNILANLGTLKCHFPYSLRSSILLANLCWEFLLAWHNNVDDLDALRAAVKCLQAVPSSHLKEGLCSLIWKMNLRSRFESAARLFQKVGKIPKERLCKQAVGISDLEMVSFLGTCMDFLDIFMEASLVSAAQAPLDVSRHEELWNCGGSGPPSLAELALSQSAVNYDLLHLHYQLALALHMLVSFSMRFHQPISSLFDNVGQAALFADLSSHPQLPSQNPDQALITTRTRYLCRVITVAMHTIQVEWDDSDQDDKVKKLDARLAVQWMSKCNNLASVWQVSSDTLRRHQICELYSNGYDRLAEEIMPALQNPSLVTSQLLVIAGQRLRQIVMNSPDMRNKMSHISPALSTWLHSLNEDSLKSSDTPDLNDLTQLLAVIMQHLPESHQDGQLTAYMVDTVQAFISSSKSRCVE